MSSQTLSTQRLSSATSLPKKWAKKAPSPPIAPIVPPLSPLPGPRPDAGQEGTEEPSMFNVLNIFHT